MTLIRYTLIPFFILLLFNISHLYGYSEFKNFSINTNTNLEQKLNYNLKDNLNINSNLDFNQLEKSLTDFFIDTYEQYGRDKAKEIIDFNRIFELGEKNKTGLHLSFSIDLFKVKIKRKLIPDLNNEEKWIVEDKMTIEINGEEYLEKMRDEGVVHITDRNLKGFLNAYFKRIYTYRHNAASYKEGILSDFRKLFFNYKYFQDHNYLNIDENEFLQKEDYIGVELLSEVETPPMHYISVKAGVKIAYGKVSNISIRRPLSSSKDSIRITSSKNEIKNFGGDVSIGTDLYKLVYLDLFSINIERYISERIKTSIHFTHSDIDTILSEGPISIEIENLINFKKADDPLVLIPFISTTESTNVDTSFERSVVLMWGGGIGNKKEYFIINDLNNQKYYTRKIHEKEFFARGLSSMFSSEYKVKFDAKKYTALQLEYKTNQDRIALPIQDDELADFNKDDNIFMKTTSMIEIKKTPRFITRKYLTRIITILENSTDDGLIIASKIKEKLLRAPFVLNFQVFIDENAITFLNESRDNRSSMVNQFCESETCNEKISDILKTYYSHIRHNNGNISITILKKFVYLASLYAKGPKDMKIFFGEDNLFINGIFSSDTKDEKPFKTYFKDGIFKIPSIIEPDLSIL